jgi:quinol monooxygenase YgiN
MTLIRANSGVITQINVFTVPPDGQQALIDHLAKAAACARQEPGWLSASLHRSLDGTQVANYAQTDSVEAAHAVIERLKAGGFLDRNRTFGAAHPGLYEVVATIER